MGLLGDTDSGGVNDLPIVDTFPEGDADDFFAPAPERLRVVPGSVDDDQGDDDGGGPRERARARLRGDRRPALERAAKTGIPGIDEWMEFFSNILIKVATDYYIDLAFNGIDEDLLTDREVQRIKMQTEERDRIARPFAELAYKSKWTRKHGRSIIAAAGSVDAVVQLGMWYSRVNRIARKYRRMSQGPPPPPMPRMQAREPQGPPPPPYMPETEGSGDERTGQSSPVNGHDRGWRPTVAGSVVRGFEGG